MSFVVNTFAEIEVNTAKVVLLGVSLLKLLLLVIFNYKLLLKCQQYVKNKK